ncbi:hypothetical protein F4803DRAFT_518020 [Xylaria telfairii]|nr:hypothetical protein F4803DRAFT_518020 [Xylaria telfairii]
MAILDWFGTTHKFRIHILQTFLTVVVFILSIAYFPTPGAIPTRVRVMIPIISVKSLIIQAYQILTEHTTRFAKWHSLKANAILNCLEVLFWAVFTGLLFSANSAICLGAACGLAWVTAFLSLFLLFSMIWMAVCSCLEFHLYRITGKQNWAQRIPSNQVWET